MGLHGGPSAHGGNPPNRRGFLNRGRSVLGSFLIAKVDPLTDLDGLLVGSLRPLEFRKVARYGDAVEEGFPDHAPGSAGDKGHFRFAAGLGGGRGIQPALCISLRGNHQTDHFLQIEAHRHKFLAQVVQGLWMGHFLVFGIIIDRLVDSPAHQFRPQAINEILGEITVPRMSHQLGEFHPVLADPVEVSPDVDGLVLILQVDVRVEASRPLLSGNRLDGGLGFVKQGVDGLG